MVKKDLTELSMSTIRRRLRAMDGWKDVDTDVIHYLSCQIKAGREDFISLQLAYEAVRDDWDKELYPTFQVALTSYLSWSRYYSSFKDDLPREVRGIHHQNLTPQILCGVLPLDSLPPKNIQAMLRMGVLRERKGKVYIPKIFRAYLRYEIGTWFVNDYALDPDVSKSSGWEFTNFVHQYFEDVVHFTPSVDPVKTCAHAASILIQMLHPVKKADWPTAFFAPDS